MDVLHSAGWFAKLTLAMGVVPLLMAVTYVIRPTERRLALMRPFSLAAIFGALSGAAVGFLNVLRAIGMTSDYSPDFFRRMAIGASESLVPVFVGFACLAAAWLVVAVGMSRTPAEP